MILRNLTPQHHLRSSDGLAAPWEDHRAAVDLVAVHPEQAQAARVAYRKYGRGRHPAALNYGDCFSYALAKISGESLLFTGADFPLTDVRAVGVEAPER